MVVAKGIGVAPSGSDFRQARDLSRRAAVLNAYRALTEEINGVHITAETTIESQIVSGDIIKTKVFGLIQGAEILSEEFSEDGTGCVVVMGIAIYGGENSLASVVFKPGDKKNFPAPKNFSSATGNYTGLVIDCSDVNLTPVLSPVIRGNDNQSIYSCDNLAYDKILANGIVGYAMTKNEKKSALVSYTALIEKKFLLLSSANEKIDLSRAGSNPLVIKATSVSDDFTCPVVSDDDADKILAENQASHFLDEGSVVFVSYRVGGVRI